MLTHIRILLAVLTCIALFISPGYAEETVDTGETVTAAENKENTDIDSDDEFDEFDDEFEDTDDDGVFDPLIGYNRFMTGVNDKMYYWLLKPVARCYGFIIPGSVRRSISRCYKNLIFPIRFVNNLLQLKFKQTATESARFTINSTIGILGLFDPAKTWGGIDPCQEDFGQTLGHYGLGGGFHVVLPVLGPSNLRDMAGLVPDYYLNPVHYIGANDLGLIAIDAGEKINYISLHIDEYESLQKDAIDFYLFMRDAYEQNRRMKIKE